MKSGMKRMNSSIIEQGELVVADILFAEQVGAKRRLALVISSTEFNRKASDIVVLKVTSLGGNTFFDVPLSNADTLKKSLKTDSTIMADFPVVIVKDNILARPDKINQNKLKEVKQKIKKLYDL